MYLSYIFFNLKVLANCSFDIFLLNSYFCFNFSFNVTCPSLLSCCCHETPMKKQLRGKGFVWLKLQVIFRHYEEVKAIKSRGRKCTNASAHLIVSTVTRPGPKPRKQCGPQEVRSSHLSVIKINSLLPERP